MPDGQCFETPDPHQPSNEDGYWCCERHRQALSIKAALEREGTD